MSAEDYFDQFTEFLTGDDMKRARRESSLVRDGLRHLGFLVLDHGFHFSGGGAGAYGNESIQFRRGTFVIELWSQEGDLPLLLMRHEIPLAENPGSFLPRGPKGGLRTALNEINPPYLVPTENDPGLYARILRRKISHQQCNALQQERCALYGRFVQDYLTVLVEKYDACLAT